jgi:hypothetical protein
MLMRVWKVSVHLDGDVANLVACVPRKLGTTESHRNLLNSQNISHGIVCLAGFYSRGSKSIAQPKGATQGTMYKFVIQCCSYS